MCFNLRIALLFDELEVLFHAVGVVEGLGARDSTRHLTLLRWRGDHATLGGVAALSDCEPLLSVISWCTERFRRKCVQH